MNVVATGDFASATLGCCSFGLVAATAFGVELVQLAATKAMCYLLPDAYPVKS